MSNLALTLPARAGVVTTGAAVASTDKIQRTVLGTRGVLLEIINGNASTDNITISDASVTPSGGAAAALTPTQTTGQSKMYKIVPAMADSANGEVTITHSVTSTVTYKMYPLD